MIGTVRSTSMTVEAWRGYRLDRFPTQSWSVDDGVLGTLTEGPQISLISIEQYCDFNLSLEWCLAPAGNSGIFHCVREDEADPSQSGLEMQLLDDARHPDARRPETSCGALYDLFPPVRKQTMAAGVFHTAGVIRSGRTVEHWLDGECVLQYSIGDAAFETALSRSKFKDLPRFARAPQGHLVLQHHGTGVWFRNIEIRTS
jgi:hypothetical protein